MAVITIFSGTFCNEEAVIDGLLKQNGFRRVADRDMVAEASRISQIPVSKITRAFSARASVFNKFTHERERSVAYLKLAMANRLSEDQLLFTGFCGQLIPMEISHVLRVCLIADMKFRLAAAMADPGLTEHDAAKLIHRQEEDCAAWIHALRERSDPWDASLYDIVIPTDKTPLEEVVAIIRDNAGKAVVHPTGHSRHAVDDFRLAAEVEVALVREGHNVGVAAKKGTITVTINKNVLMLSRLEAELKAIAGRVTGVDEVKTQVGPGFHQADIYRRHDFEMPSKILLVDDEREFVQTLSERLLMRDMGSAVAYDGESALEVAREDEPDVMILDLRMPGIDGIEVLRRVKGSQPEIEVIILTGHGSEADRRTCLEMGAFAYLQKPVDIEELSETIKKANEKIRRKRSAQG
jgi:two-component system response regulator CpxR